MPFSLIPNFKNAKRNLYYCALSIFGSNNYKRFIVLSRGRSGSNLLISLLDSHPHVRAKGEIFHWLAGKNYKAILNRAFSKKPSFIRAAGFKIFYYHPIDNPNYGIWNYNAHGIWNDLISIKDLHIIHLKRRNILNTLISLKIANKQKIWSNTKEDKVNSSIVNKVEFTVDELKESFANTRWLQELGDKLFTNHRILNIFYEDLAKNIEDEFKKITDFLELEYYKPITRFLKQNRRSKSEVVAKYNELKAAFQNTEWKEFFNDET